MLCSDWLVCVTWFDHRRLMIWKFKIPHPLSFEKQIMSLLKEELQVIKVSSGNN